MRELLSHDFIDNCHRLKPFSVKNKIFNYKKKKKKKFFAKTASVEKIFFFYN